MHHLELDTGKNKLSLVVYLYPSTGELGEKSLCYRELNCSLHMMIPTALRNCHKAEIKEQKKRLRGSRDRRKQCINSPRYEVWTVSSIDHLLRSTSDTKISQS